MSSTRPTRSRFSSPHAATLAKATSNISNATAGKSLNQGQGTSDGWVEPTVVSQPSFKDAGIERHGVVLNMQPLGSRPPAKMLKAAARAEAEGMGRTSMAKKSTPSSVSTPGGESALTPELQAQPEPAADSSMEPTIKSPIYKTAESPPLPTTETEEEMAFVQPESDMEQNTGSSAEPAARTEPEPEQQRAESASTDKTEELPLPELQPQTPQRPFVAHSSISHPSTGIHANRRQEMSYSQYQAVQSHDFQARGYATGRWIPAAPSPELDAEGYPEINLERTDRVLENAVQDAVDRHRWPTAYALRTLYDKKRLDRSFVRLIEAICEQRATREQEMEFEDLIRPAKHEGKKGRTGDYYFNGDGSGSVPSRPIVAALQALNPLPATPYQSPYDLPPRPSTGTIAPQASSWSSTNDHASTPVSPRQTPEDAHISKKQRSNSFQPANSELDGYMGTSANGTVANSPITSPIKSPAKTNGVARSTLKSTPKRAKRSDSVSSDSSALSSALSIDEEELETVFHSDIATMASGAPMPEPGIGGLEELSSRIDSSRIDLIRRLGQAPEQRVFVSPYASANSFSAAASSAATASASSAETLARTQARQPTTVPTKAGPKTFTFPVTGSKSPAVAHSSSSTTASSSTNPSAKSSSTTTATPIAKAPMAPAALLSPEPAVAGNAEPQEAHFTPAHLEPKNSSKAQVTHDENDTTSAMKQKARAHTSSLNIGEINERHAITTTAPKNDAGSDTGDFVAIPATKRAKVRLSVGKSDRPRRHRGNNDDSEEASSPTLSNFKPDLPLAPLPSSRAGTPINTRGGRKARTGSGLRTKNSPVKKKTTITAGALRPSREKEKPEESNGLTQEDNVDYCLACGGNGSLVCCDGCASSFHHKCNDPPMSENDAAQYNEFYCYQCQSKRKERENEEHHYPGHMGPLLTVLDGMNPKVFQLPSEIRDYFEDVKTGEDGEYQEVTQPKPKNNKPGWDDRPDYFKKLESNGSPVLCHHCHGEASFPNKMVIPCSFCDLSWHLECLPIPLAKAPGHGRKWRCPAHIDDLLSHVPEHRAPAHRFRIPKEGKKAADPLFGRGVKNHGYIEVINDESDNEEVGFFDQREYGHIYKLPELGIKLDFIAKVKSLRTSDPGSLNASGISPPQKTVPWSRRDIDDQQAALNLASFASQVPATEGVDKLIKALVAEAPPAAVALLAQGDAVEHAHNTAPDKVEISFLTALISRAQIRLSQAEKSELNPNPALVSTPPPMAPGHEIRGNATSTKKGAVEVRDNEGDLEMSH